MTAPTPEQVKEAVEALTPWVEYFDTSATHHIRTILAALEESRKDSARFELCAEGLHDCIIHDDKLGQIDPIEFVEEHDTNMAPAWRRAIDAAIAAAAQAKGETS